MQNDHPITFFWYDYETFGLSQRKDMPAQFAGIRTNAALDRIEPSVTLYMKPSMDTLPSPTSVLLTHILPQKCFRDGVTERRFAKTIWEAFNQPNTISIGYNTLGFDNQVSRFLFWRNFRSAYTHEWKNGCQVWDLFPVICAYWSMRGQGIHWPEWKNLDPQKYDTRNKEGVCFKLEALTRANGLSHRHAHDALSDVEATIALAKLLKKANPRFWDWALANRTKRAVVKTVEAGPFLWFSPKFGQASGFVRATVAIGRDPKNRNSVWTWDLMHDPEELRSLTAEDWQRRMGRSEDLREGEERLPVYSLRVNASPIVINQLKALPKERAQAFGIDRNVVQANYQKFLTMQDEIRSALMHALETRQKTQKDRRDSDETRPEEMLYDMDFDRLRPDEHAMQRVSVMSLEALAQRNIHFRNPRLSLMLFHYRARNDRSLLTAREKKVWRQYCYARLVNGYRGARTIHAFDDEIDALVRVYNDREDVMRFLEALHDWGVYLGEYCSAQEK